MMAQAPPRPAPNLRLTPILDEVARYLGRHGLREGAPGSAKGTLRIELERHVRRTVQVYWTPFMVEIEGDSVGLHLEVAEPRVHWAEAYLSPDQRNWVLFFGDRVLLRVFGMVRADRDRLEVVRRRLPGLRRPLLAREAQSAGQSGRGCSPGIAQEVDDLLDAVEARRDRAHDAGVVPLRPKGPEDLRAVGGTPAVASGGRPDSQLRRDPQVEGTKRSGRGASGKREGDRRGGSVLEGGGEQDRREAPEHPGVARGNRE